MNWEELPASSLETLKYHHAEVEQIVQSVQDGVYCAVLGPRLCGKTELLHYVVQVLDEYYGWPCIYIDLMDMRSSNIQGFFAEIIQLTNQRFAGKFPDRAPVLDEEVASSAAFRAFLSDCVMALGEDLVVIIEHLETLPTDLIQALLTSLRAAYMDQQTQEQRVIVVVSGALSLATLTVGESSPFRGIARRVFIPDLTLLDSQDLICGYFQDHGVSCTLKAAQRLLQASSGDPYLIRELCQRGVDRVQGMPSRRLTSANVTQITNHFLRQEVYHYAPLLEAVRLIEEEPDLLRCILLLLEGESVPRSVLPLPLSPDLDPLFLTGVVEMVGGDAYRLQNDIYRQFLRRYFLPGRVGHVLAMTGLWELALDQMEIAVHQGEVQSSSELMPAVINSIYAAQDLRQAAHFLACGLAAVFGVHEAYVWYVQPMENRLHLLRQWGAGSNQGEWTDSEISINADRLEARAFRQSSILRSQDRDGQLHQAFPLLVPGQTPIGVVTVVESRSSSSFLAQRERDLKLNGFLRQAARALNAVSMRRQELILAGRLQASLLPDSPPQAHGWQFACAWRPARETAGDFYDYIAHPNGKIGLVIADVADKGMGAALYMALSRTLLRTFAADYPDEPGKVLLAANARMLADSDTGHFVTLVYGVLDPGNGCFTYANAGHHPPYLFQLGGKDKAHMLRPTGPALGVMPDGVWQQVSVQVEPGQMLLFYTDGLVDAQSPEHMFFGDWRLLETAGKLDKPSAQDALDALLSQVRAFSGDAAQYDDITVMVVLRELGL